MKNLEPLNGMTLEQALVFLLSFDNALSFDEKRLMKSYKPGVSLKKGIGLFLCGGAGFDLVVLVMEGDDLLKPFLANVSCNSVESVPLILKVLQSYIINKPQA